MLVEYWLVLLECTWLVGVKGVALVAKSWSNSRKPGGAHLHSIQQQPETGLNVIKKGEES